MYCPSSCVRSLFLCFVGFSCARVSCKIQKTILDIYRWPKFIYMHAYFHTCTQKNLTFLSLPRLLLSCQCYFFPKNVFLVLLIVLQKHQNWGDHRICQPYPLLSLSLDHSAEHISPLVPISLYVESLASNLLAPLWSASFFPTFFHSVPLRSALLISLISARSALLTHLRSAQLWFLCSCSALLAPICTSCLCWLSLAQLSQLSSVFRSSRSSGPSNLSLSNLPLGSISPYPSLYYNIEVISNLNIDLIFIIVTIMHSPTSNAAGILVLNSDPDSYFCPGCAEQSAKTDFEILPQNKISPQQENPGGNHRVTR